MMQKVSIDEVRYLVHAIAQKMMTWDEPIPDFSTRFPHKLESTLLTPFQSFGGQQLYPGMYKKAAMLFYLIVKNHPFQNGNKRIAVITLLLFLYKNKKWIKVGNQELYNFAIWIAQSPPELKDNTVDAAVTFLKKHVVDAE